MIERYLAVTYLDGGREWPCLDCWGLARLARHDLYGLPLLRSLGYARREQVRSLQRGYREQLTDMEPCGPAPGAIAAAFRGELLVHVGLVVKLDGRLCVLEINPDSNVSTPTVQDFVARFLRVSFYRDRDLPQQA